MKINKVFLCGKLMRDPNIGLTEASKQVANLEILTDESYVNSTTGETVNKVERHRIVAWGKQAEKCKVFKKDDLVYVEGKNQTRRTDEGLVGEIVAHDVQLVTQ